METRKTATDYTQKREKRNAAIKKHNKTVLSQAKPGDMIQIDRKYYQHWAIYTGNGRVIHLSSENCDVSQTGGSEVKVREDDFWKATGDNPAVINNDKDLTLKPFPPTETVRRAKSSLDEEGYNWMLFNCEHFASWCRYGRRQSDQVDEAAVAGARMFGPSGKGILHVYGLIKTLADPK